jgi:DNA-binding protein HU-beta
VTFETLTDTIAARHGLTKHAARALVHELFELITQEATWGDRMAIPGFGTFRLVRRKARVIEHPVTRRPMKLKASKTISFRAAKSVKEGL